MSKDASDKDKPAERAILRAILNAKKKFGPLLKDKTNPFYKSKYSDLPALMDVVEGPLLDEDVVILQPTIVKPEGQYVRTRLVHVSGDEESGELMLPAGLDAQKTVAAITYYKRATLQALLSIPARDDDGETTNGRGDYDPNHPTSAPKPPTRPPAPAPGPGGSFTTDPRQAAKDKKKAEEAAKPAEAKGKEATYPANVVIKSIAPGNHPTVKFSKLETTGGTFIVMGDSEHFAEVMKAAQVAALNKTNVIIEYHVNQKGSNIVDVLRVEE